MLVWSFIHDTCQINVFSTVFAARYTFILEGGYWIGMHVRDVFPGATHTRRRAGITRELPYLCNKGRTYAADFAYSRHQTSYMAQ